MDGQVTARTLVCAIPRAIVFCWLMTRMVELCRMLTEVAVEFLKPVARLAVASHLQVRHALRPPAGRK
jgi:hypothetical protein